jgi:hypothetical protein
MFRASQVPTRGIISSTAVKKFSKLSRDPLISAAPGLLFYASKLPPVRDEDPLIVKLLACGFVNAPVRYNLGGDIAGRVFSRPPQAWCPWRARAGEFQKTGRYPLFLFRHARNDLDLEGKNY